MFKTSNDTPPLRRNHGCGLIFFGVMLVIGALWGAGLGVFVYVLDDAKTTIAALEEFRPKLGTKVYSTDGVLLGEFATQQRQAVPLGEIPLHLQKAFVATEDDRFYEHKGVRLESILNALLYKAQTGRTRGGSTITQQVVRNVDTLDVGQQVSLKRKIREAIVSLQVEREFTKDEIMEIYLNQIFLGVSAFGVEVASQQYFGKSCRDVTLGEAAMLAGITRSPNKQDPIRNIENAYTRRNVVLGQMLENRLITQEQHDAALREDPLYRRNLVVKRMLDQGALTQEEFNALMKEANDLAAKHNLPAAPPDPAELKQLEARAQLAGKMQKFLAPYFVEEVSTFVQKEFGTDKVFEDGLQVYGTLDMRLQRVAEEALLSALDDFDAKKLDALKKAGKESEFIPVSGALVCLDNRPPNQGFVRAMVGGRNYDIKKFNDATQAWRQPGSSIKPFVWSAAVASGMTPSTIIVDEPFVRVDSLGKVYAPKNFDGKFRGAITLRHALEQSVNIVSIKLVEQLGPPLIMSYLRNCGVVQQDKGRYVGLSVGLGAVDVRILDLCAAYSCFANNGMRFSPVMVQEILNRDGIKQYDCENFRTHEQALDPKVAYVTNHMLQGVCTPDRPGNQPTAWRTKDLERPRGGKTGTSNESRNVWFCGFTPDYTTVVWIGYDDNRELGRGANFTGGRLACPIWTQFMVEAHRGLPVHDFKMPDGVQMFNIDRYRGTLGGDYPEAYVAGTAPPGAWAAPTEESAPEGLEESLLEVF